MAPPVWAPDVLPSAVGVGGGAHVIADRHVGGAAAAATGRPGGGGDSHASLHSSRELMRIAHVLNADDPTASARGGGRGAWRPHRWDGGGASVRGGGGVGSPISAADHQPAPSPLILPPLPGMQPAVPPTAMDVSPPRRGAETAKAHRG
eukprot:TRINITY_DN7881_c0_g1_i1.p3 TRINITY_DN7881_c0_g1~~TRINITY_DN7881_c0_g1_i1.p3  ORF type:complete len:149 (-),score=37.49 TRINITY_DN7881_c0_g1_i1:3-449(-)